MTTTERTELISPGPVTAIAGLLGVVESEAEQPGRVPMLWQCGYLLDRPAQADLGADGHRIVDALPEPPGPGLRRMFGGGRCRFAGRLRVGEPALRRTSVLRTTEKHGRSGPFILVTVGHEYLQDGRTVIVEENDIIFRPPDAQGDRPAAPAPAEPADWSALPAEAERWTFRIDPVVLFRFSALTYNSHRIHYDRPYATGVENYPGLVVQGPLLALVMAEGVRRLDGRPAPPAVTFEFRVLGPLFDDQDATVRVVRQETSATARVDDPTGRCVALAVMTDGG